MNKSFKLSAVALLLTIGTASVSQASIVILSDDFSSGSVTTTFRAYESNIDTGWRKAPGYGSVQVSEWTIASGVAGNASTVAGSGYPTTQPSETPLINFFSAAGSTETHLRFEFDYNVTGGDKLYAHLWAITGTSDFDGEFVSNIEGAHSGNVNTTNNSGELTAYNLKNGATGGIGGASQAISGELTGSGSFHKSFSIADLGISGVTTAGDIGYYLVQISKDEDGTAGNTSIDNFSLIANVPEPSAFAMFGLVAAGLGFRRRK